MLWNWEKDDWPNFGWDASRLVQAEQAFLVGGGMLLGTARHLSQEEQDALKVEMMSREAVATSEIEGEILDRISVQSSIRRQLGLAADGRHATQAEQGIAEMTVDVSRTFRDPLTHDTLFSWHALITKGRKDLTDIGRYRTHGEPMQVVSSRIDKPVVYFEAPPSSRVPDEMDAFLTWFNHSSQSLPALARAGIAHLYFVSVHPFEDGNGRVGRAVSEKALAQGFGQPTLLALSPAILARRKSYYEALEAANQSNEITDWLSWFAAITLEAQQRTLDQILFILDKTRLLDRLRGALNGRQEKALLRILRAGPEGFIGGLSAGNYRTLTKAPHATATRDLADLVEKGALIPRGEFKGRRYHLNIARRLTPRVTVNENGEVVKT